MNKYIKLDKTHVLVKANDYIILRLELTNDIMKTSMCYECVVDGCISIKLKKGQSFLCNGLNDIGYERIKLINKTTEIKESLFINLLLTKLIRNHEERRFIKIETRKQV